MKKVSVIVLAAFSLFLLESASSAFVDVHKGKANDVEYMTGGVGIDERQAMEEMAKGYNLKVVLAMIKGHYLADVPVTIMKPTGEKVLETVAAGPWLYAKLPHGQYTVKVSFDGKERTRTVDVGGDMKVAMFHWMPTQHEKETPQ
jgi:hypothetical protein